MDIELLALCNRVVDRVLSSPISLSINQYISVMKIPDPFTQNYYESIKKLKNNQFKTPKEFLNAYNNAVDEIIDINDCSSDLFIAILSIQQQINEEMNIFVCGTKKEFTESTSKFTGSLRDRIPEVPNDLESFKQTLQRNNNEISENKHEENENIQIDPGEMLQMRQKIQYIDNDENLQKIGQIVKLNEENAIITDSGNIEFDLFKCNKYTISLIRELLANVTVKIPEEQPPNTETTIKI